jgi:hypothetical protein
MSQQDHVETLRISGTIVKIGTTQEDWVGEVGDPEEVIRAVRLSPERPDIFTFCQRLPDTEPLYPFYMEWDQIAVIRVDSYEEWFHRIKKSARNAIRRAESKGVEVRLCEYDDEFVEGIVSICNEAPMRQGRKFPYYGMDHAAVKREFAPENANCIYLGSYWKGELIGFAKLYMDKKALHPFGLFSKLAHRDKPSQNALLAKAVEICEARNLPYVHYGPWTRLGLGDFKRHNACEKMGLPRYYVPLTLKGRIALLLRLHQGISRYVPESLAIRVIDLRRRLAASASKA